MLGLCSVMLGLCSVLCSSAWLLALAASGILVEAQAVAADGERVGQPMFGEDGVDGLGEEVLVESSLVKRTDVESYPPVLEAAQDAVWIGLAHYSASKKLYAA